ncbi:hypothetical protein JOM56_013962 [Amanita muscaria]
MSQRTQHWLPSEQSGVPNCNRTDESLTQVSWVQCHHSTAAPSQLQGQPASPQEILLAPYPGYTSHYITPVSPLICNATQPDMIEEQDNMASEHDHLPNQELADIADQFYFSFDGNELSSPGDGQVLWPLPISSNGAVGPPTPSTTTGHSSQSPVGTSTAGPRVIELVAADNSLRAVGSPQIQQAAGKRRTKNGIYQCTFRNAGCNATFTARHNLRYHLNAHRGLKPYECTECSYAATSPTALKRHMKRHPSSSSEAKPHTLYYYLLQAVHTTVPSRP